MAIALAKARSLLNNGRYMTGSVTAVLCRPLSTPPSDPKHPRHSSKYVKSIPDKDIKKSVFISQSNDVFANLALEDWIYRNYDFTTHHVLMLWRNKPCVVIGRHQNPFVEANVSALVANDITLARRNSGGGAVYHDMGNLNCTFFTPRERYDRKYNLTLLMRAVYRAYDVRGDITERDDITVNGKKVVSGTAAKLGQPNAYHHCTMLVNCNKVNLHNALQKDPAEIIGNATKSVPSPTKNLVELNNRVEMDDLLQAVGLEYLRTPATSLTDGGEQFFDKQRGFQLINPTEKWFPGLDESKKLFSSWDWRFGKTPRFTVVKEIQLKSDVSSHDVKVNVDVEGGLINEVTLIVPNLEPIPVVTTMKGRPYTEDNFHGIIRALKESDAILPFFLVVHFGSTWQFSFVSFFCLIFYLF